ncbi:metallophosphoesterase [Peribacillus kribbensis]|uniref:metallophosphoesterase n=1 Tax=Peribacillus kribbensis TaxID=356658 RepID=UPI0009D74E90|nr:metallophosphoesterase [Peribacillus kribbensis]
MGWNIWKWLHMALGFQHPEWFILIYALVSYAYILSRKWKNLKLLRTVGSVWMGFFQYGVLIFPAADLLVLILIAAGVTLEHAVLFSGLAALLAFLVLFGLGLFNAYSPVIRKYEIEVKHKNSGRKSIRMAVASDMHFGWLSGAGHARRLVRKVKDLEPDLILLPGDIIDDEPGPFVEKKIDQILKELQAPLGVFGVLGNHEYYGGEIPEYLNIMDRIDIKILMDEVVKIDEGLYLIGRKDRMDAKRKSFQELAEKVDRSSTVISMDHQPYELHQAEEAGVDILFSGHTHRGQMAPNHLITRKMYELDWGYKKKNQLHAFVSSGYGFWGPPLRLGSRSEILQVDVRFI